MKRISVVLIAGFLIFVSAQMAMAGKSDKLSEKTPGNINLSKYILGPGDKLEIKVYRNDDLYFTQQIDASGKISYPLLGEIQAAGLTPYALKMKLTHGLSKFFKDPQVMINVTAYQSNTITVIGNVSTPGVFTIDHSPTILEIISRSGSFKSNADKSHVMVIRKQDGTSTVLKLDLKKALEGDRSQDILLVKDDVVYVPSDINKVIVLGAVTNPGTVILDKEIDDTPMSLLEVITKAGGFTPNADRSGVVVIRKDNEQTITKKYDLKQLLEKGDISQNVMALKGDIIFVPKIEKKIVVMGEISQPGTIQFETPPTVTELLSKAGGFTTNAGRNNILIIRNNKGVSQLISVNIEKTLEQGDATQNPLLQDGDIVYVPREDKRVLVLGEVTTPGYYNLYSKMTVIDAISKSGGLTKNADEKKIVVVRQKAMKIINVRDILRKGELDQNMELQNGDIVYAPMTSIANFESFLSHINTIFFSFTQVSGPIVLWPQIKSAVQDKSNTTSISIPVGGSK